MKATDFNLSKDLEFSLETGQTMFKGSRLVMFSTDAIGLLRQNLIEELGLEKAREFFLRFGYENGFTDFMQMKIGYKFDSELELLSSGPVIHTWEGIVRAIPKELEYDRETGHFLFTGIWKNSYEAEQHLMHNNVSDDVVCWSLMGYASGWSTGFFGKPLLAIEPLCMGKGDDHCEWKIQPPDKWGNEANPYIKALKGYWEGN